MSACDQCGRCMSLAPLREQLASHQRCATNGGEKGHGEVCEGEKSGEVASEKRRGE